MSDDRKRGPKGGLSLEQGTPLPLDDAEHSYSVDEAGWVQIQGKAVEQPAPVFRLPVGYRPMVDEEPSIWERIVRRLKRAKEVLANG